MKFHEWQTTGKFVEDLRTTDYGDSLGFDGPQAGHVYYGGFIMRHGPDRPKDCGEYHVLICNEEWTYDNLSDAEARLWCSWVEGEVGDTPFEDYLKENAEVLDGQAG